MKVILAIRPVFLLTLLSTLFLCSCTKSENDCPSPDTIELRTNGPIIVGNSLLLETNYDGNYLYNWYGPNGYKLEYEYFSSQANAQELPALTKADAGEYKVQLKTAEGCIAYEGTVNVEVIDAPAPPCTIPANTSEATVAGVGNYNFNYRTFQTSSSYYLASGSEVVPGGDNMRFAFIGQTPPIPGIYKTDGYFPTENKNVGLYIEAITYQFVANPGQNVYVNLVNGKLEISFCDVVFNNPINPAKPFKVSARMVQP